MNEKWRDVPGLPYEASDFGRVRNRRQHVLKPFKNNKYGHLGVKLNRKTYLLHRVVLETWVGPAPHGTECRHLDGNPENNQVSNLKWGTRSENQIDRHKHTDHFANVSVRRSDGKIFKSLRDAAGATPGTNFQNIWKVCNGKRQTAGGYCWEYA